MELWEIAIVVAAAVAGIVAGWFIGIAIYRKKHQDAKAKIENADNEAIGIINKAVKTAESRKEEMLLEAKEEIHRSRTEYEKEVKERRAGTEGSHPGQEDRNPRKEGGGAG